MKLKLLRQYSFDDFYGTYLSFKSIKKASHAVLRFDIPYRSDKRLFYIGSMENTNYTELNVELKRIL